MEEQRKQRKLQSGISYVQLRNVLAFLSVTGLLILFFTLSLPRPLFSDPLSTVVFDRNNELLGARIAADGQWRFPGLDSVPLKYEHALLSYEDRYFRQHPGINPVSIGRALIQNISAGEIVSGGSTITMQVMRMSRKNKKRTLFQKFIESFQAVALELTRNKNEILNIYANNAPYGGNVVGLEAAAWRYFGTSPFELTWSESSLLAILPNAPSLIHPGKNRQLLKSKRDALLLTLYERGYMDEITLDLAREEPLPQKPGPLPDLSPHLSDRMMLEKRTKRVTLTLDAQLQERTMEIIKLRHQALSANEIHNLACLVMEVESGKVLAYVGNSRDDGSGSHGNSVDVITAERSTGSILKPFLFAGMLDNGDLLQSTLVPDVPIRYNGYAPKNYDRQYQGAIPAYKALERSLNIPSVIMLQQYGVDPFLSLLRKLGFTSFRHSHEYYGLTLILGGAESSLWELAGVYGSLARVLNNYSKSDGYYFNGDYHMPLIEKNAKPVTLPGKQEEGLLSAGSIYLTFESLLQVNRPEELSLWYLMSSSRNIAWKTGTSYGFRDAWAIGVTPEYLVAVWAGNADGEGRPGLTGLTSAAPLMFDVFSLLPETTWFEKPYDNLKKAAVCSKSGAIAGPNCPEVDSIWVVSRGLRSKACSYHKIIHLDENELFRVNSDCYPVDKMVNKAWFVLPPLMEWYYKQNEASYNMLPPVMAGCRDETINAMEIVYPQWDSHLVIPTELDGSRGNVVLEVAHRDENAKVFWHLDEEYLTTTLGMHQLAIDISPGPHRLTVLDEAGNKKSVRFEVLR